MKSHASDLNSLLCLVVLASLVNGCSSSARLPCPEPGEELADLSTEEERVALTIQNNTCMSICEILVSPNHCEYMGGVNWLEDHPLRSEESVTQDIPPGRFAVWVELCTEEFRADENLNVETNYTHTIIDDPTKGGKPPCETWLTIVNNSAVPICKMWISNSDSAYTSWNWIGAEHIQPSESIVLALRPGTYIIRAEECDGTWLRSEVEVSVSGNQIWTVP